MEASRAEGKRSLKEDDQEEEEDDEDSGGGIAGDEDKIKKKGKRGSSSAGAGGATTFVSCQVENCRADMTDAKKYHRRHKVCDFHAKAPVVRVEGLAQRFCQQCSRFHELSEFDDTKRSCRRRLAGHNERRRKSSADYHGEGSN
ncbi:hypothetical protein AB3S75_008303 [Citrus x aurantiifolia]